MYVLILWDRCITSCCSVTQSCPTFNNPMDCRTPGFPVFPYLPEFAQTHVHWVGDIIQPSHPLSPPSPLALCPTLSGQCRAHRFDPWVGKIPWRRAWQPAPVFLPGESHGQRSLVGYTVHRVTKSQTQLKLLSMHTRKPCLQFFLPLCCAVKAYRNVQLNF